MLNICSDKCCMSHPKKELALIEGKNAMIMDLEKCYHIRENVYECWEAVQYPCLNFQEHCRYLYTPTEKPREEIIDGQTLVTPVMTETFLFSILLKEGEIYQITPETWTKFFINNKEYILGGLKNSRDSNGKETIQKFPLDGNELNKRCIKEKLTVGFFQTIANSALGLIAITFIIGITGAEIKRRCQMRRQNKRRDREDEMEAEPPYEHHFIFRPGGQEGEDGIIFTRAR